MDHDQARARLIAQRTEVAGLLRGAGTAARQDQVALGDVGDSADSAQALSAAGVDDAVVVGLRDRMAAIERALRRLDDGTYGFSVRSGERIPDARLEANPAAELTVAEARNTQ